MLNRTFLPKKLSEKDKFQNNCRKDRFRMKNKSLEEIESEISDIEKEAQELLQGVFC